MLGGGTGALLDAVLTQGQPGTILFVEASSAMLVKARRRVQHHPLFERVIFRHGTETSLLPGETFDVVILPFVLDVLPETALTQRFLPALLGVTAPGGCWLVTDFVPSPKVHHRLLLQTMYVFFGLVSGIEARQLPNWPHLLTRAGLVPGPQQNAVGGQVQTGVWFTKAP